MLQMTSSGTIQMTRVTSVITPFIKINVFHSHCNTYPKTRCTTRPIQGQLQKLK